MLAWRKIVCMFFRIGSSVLLVAWATGIPAVAKKALVTDRTGILTSSQIPAVATSETSTFLALPHIRQEPELCVPTSAAMVLSYFGDPHPPRQLKVLSRGRIYDPDKPFKDFTITWWRDLISGMKQLGYSWSERGFRNDSRGFRAGIEAIKVSLRSGNPILVDVALFRSHTFVIVGYDDEQKLIYFNDPNIPKPGIRRLTFEQLESIWNGLSYGVDARPALFTQRLSSSGAP